MSDSLPTDTSNLTILDFIDQLGVSLYPVQRFLLKMCYNLPLSSKDGCAIEHPLKGTVHGFSEVSYLKHLYEEGRCNIAEQDGKNRNQLTLQIGRRCGKSILLNMIALYELEKYLRLGNTYYGIPPFSQVAIRTVHLDKAHSGLMFESTREYILQRPLLAHCLKTNTLDQFKFEKDGTKVRLIGQSCAQVHGLRGSANHCLVFDEAAYQPNFEEVYNSATPSVAAFSPKDENHRPIGHVESKIFTVSTKNQRLGKFNQMLDFAFSEVGENFTLGIKLPTWHMNPTIASSFYQTAWKRDPEQFKTEFDSF